QTMVGLPGENFEHDEYTAACVIGLKPDCVRIYPVLVLKDTELERMSEEGKYVPMSLNAAVERVAAVLNMYINNNINVIKVGLHPSDEYGPGGKLVAGPFHPSFREMAMTAIWKHEFSQKLLSGQKPDKSRDLTISVPDSQYNYAIGYKSENKCYLKQYFNRVRFIRSDVLHKLDFNVDYR
ncbi:MAG TPA: hypothetical protein PKH58_10900, partial [Paludibacteraceae bacterium]|nr:hypothetical protein [Paludibacteraceae bacterium]